MQTSSLARLLTVTVTFLTAVTGIAVIAAAPANAVESNQLTVAPTGYDANSKLTVDSFAYDEALPSYQFSVTEVATGRVIPLGYASATESYSGEFEHDASVTTAQPLAVGSVYEAVFNMRTVGHWHCSVYYRDGCLFLEAENLTKRWRFTWTGLAVQGAPYIPPKGVTRIGVIRTTLPAGGWKVTARLLSNGAPAADQLLIGQFRRSGGAWRKDGGRRVNSMGRLTVRFDGEGRPTTYRFLFKGTSELEPAFSKTFSIARR